MNHCLILKTMNYQSKIISFELFEVKELYEVLRLRSDIFVVEQQCIFLDMDNLDQVSMHLLVTVDSQLAAYCRIIPPGKLYSETSIGRVVTAMSYRNRGLGRLMMEEAILYCKNMFPQDGIRIMAQEYLENFYSSLGFKSVSAPFLEDDISHVYMIL